MTNAKTLNQIIAELEAWASSHLQVHSFGQGDIWEVSPSSSAFTFPLMWVTPSTAEPRQNELVEQFNVIVCDLVDTGEANELEVLSDTRQILKDLVSWYRQQHSAAYIVEFQGAITPFTERFAERVSGNALTIRLRQPDDYDECAIPLGTPIPAPPFCEPATYTLNDTSTPPNQLSSGSIPSGGSAVIVAPDGNIELNGTPVGVVASGDTTDIPIIQDGSPVGSWNGTQWVIPSCPAGGVSISVTVSDNNPNVGQTITITATPSAGYSPTNYLFLARQNGTIFEIANGAANVVTWTVTIIGTFDIIVQAVEATDKAWNDEGVTAASGIITLGLELWGDPLLSNVVPPIYPDISGNGRDGTMINAPTFVPGTLAPNGGGYLELNGIDQYVGAIGGLADFSFIQNTLQFTMSVWVRVTDLTGRNTGMSNTTSSVERGCLLYALDTSSLLGGITKGIAFQATRGVNGSFYGMKSANDIITSVGWHQVTVTCNGIGTGQIYLDGQPIATTIVSATPALSTGNSTHPMMVGVTRSANTFLGHLTGRVGPWQVYDRPLSAAEVLANFDADKARYGL